MSKLKIYIFGLETLEATSGKKFYNELFHIKNYFEAGYADRVAKPEQADFILVIGGDGMMLEAIQNLWRQNKPFFGLNFGHEGFLLNAPNHPTVTLNELSDQKIKIISSALLQADQVDADGKIIGTQMAFNDFVIERADTQTAKIKVAIDGETLFDHLTCDGIIVCTAAGSTSYSASAGGVILPINTNSLVITGICPAIFENWHYSVLADDSQIELTPVEISKRPVRFVVDGQKLPDCASVQLKLSDQIVRLAFVQSQFFQRKVRRLQFNKLAKRKEL